MHPFPNFFLKYGSGKDRRSLPLEIIDMYSSRVPSELIDLWKNYGLCSYINGLFIMLNPVDFEEEKRMWIGDNSDDIIFARDAFGDLIVYSNHGVELIFVQYGKRLRASESLLMFFEFNLLYKDFIENSLDGKFYKKVVKKLGVPDIDECFGFFPALALGGTGTLDTVKKVKVKEHLSLLRQLVP